MTPEIKRVVFAPALFALTWQTVFWETWGALYSARKVR